MSVGKQIKAVITAENISCMVLYLIVTVPFFFISFQYPGYGGPLFLAVLLTASAFMGHRQDDLERSIKLLFVSSVLAGISIFAIANVYVLAFIDIFKKSSGWFRVLDPDYMYYFTAAHYSFWIFGVVLIFMFMTFIVGMLGNALGYFFSSLIIKKKP